MLSGLHTVCSVYCNVCDNDKAIGWKYVIYKSLNFRLKLMKTHKNLSKEGIFYKDTILKNKIGMKTSQIKVTDPFL